MLEKKIALITCAYNNADVINWLTIRGKHIKNEDWKQVDKSDAFIQNKIKGNQYLLD
jgi:hypothetical protein